jgi:hypothetical protein
VEQPAVKKKLPASSKPKLYGLKSLTVTATQIKTCRFLQYEVVKEKLPVITVIVKKQSMGFNEVKME